MNYTYFLILLVSMAVPLALILDKRTGLLVKYKAFLPSISIVAVFFLFLEYFLTAKGILGFHNDFITGIFIGELPIEEILFFFAIPFLGIAVYEYIKLFVKPDWNLGGFRIGAFVLSIALVALCFLNTNADYTFYSFLTAGIMIYVPYKSKNPNMGLYLISLGVALIPISAVYWFSTSLPLISYDYIETSGFRLGTIPIENFALSTALLIANFLVYDLFRKRMKR